MSNTIRPIEPNGESRKMGGPTNANSEVSQSHLTDDEFVAIVFNIKDGEEIPEEQESRICQHIAICEDCEKGLEQFFDNYEQFPQEEWEKRREAFVQRVRESIFGKDT